MHPSADHTVRHSRRSAAIALWVALCLLLAQWLGYAHAIGHPGLTAEPRVSQISTSAQFSAADPASDSITSAFDHQKSLNACAALDAATLGASLHSPPVLAIFLTLPSATADTTCLSVWQQSFAALFSSRAPPLLH